MESLMDVNVFSTDESEEENSIQIRKQYVLRDRANHFELWDDTEFFARFRITKCTFLKLFGQIEEQLVINCNKSRSLSPINQLLLSLRFYATGNFLRASGDFSGVCISTACRTVRKVSAIIAILGKQTIRMPSCLSEIRNSQQKFYAMHQFPRLIGCIDCTHIKIQSPGGDMAEIFRNRKGYFSLNVQVVCDANMKAINIVARWPGSSHDSTIFSQSNLCSRFQNNNYYNGVLLGDGGYAVTKFLLTPLLNPISRGEMIYNERHIRTRNIIERFFGVWKRRFPVLSLGLRLKLETVQAIIVATAYLHNLARDAREEEPPVEPGVSVDNYIDISLDISHDYVTDNSVRRSLIEDYFSWL